MLSRHLRVTVTLTQLQLTCSKISPWFDIGYEQYCIMSSRPSSAKNAITVVGLLGVIGMFAYAPMYFRNRALVCEKRSYVVSSPCSIQTVQWPGYKQGLTAVREAIDREPNSTRSVLEFRFLLFSLLDHFKGLIVFQEAKMSDQTPIGTQRIGCTKEEATKTLNLHLSNWRHTR